VQYYLFITDSDLYCLVTELTYLVAFIPLPVYNFVQFTKMLFFYAFDYTGLNLGLVVFCLGLARLISSRSLSHCLNMVVLTSLWCVVITR